MKQILQNLKSGATNVVEVPSPPVKSGHLRIKTTVSLISAGTERMLVDFGRANYIDKARQQPEKVAQVVRKIGTDGLSATVGTVMAKLDEPQALGYSNVGVVTDVGDGVSGYEVGDRVVSNGRHAEIVNVPMNLCAKIPDQVSDEMAAFTVVGSIGLQGIRLAQPTLGEAFVVYGLGLIGLLTAQMLKANGCRVLGLDVSSDRVAMARSFGIEAINLGEGTDPVSAGLSFSGGAGLDGVLVTASAKDDGIMHNAAEMCRKRGRIVLVGVTGLKLNRSDFYEKELSFQVSCSYGPGRYDPLYEDNGQDYPLGFVRWTEQRNFEAVLELMANQAMVTEPLISLRETVDNAPAAYEQVVNGGVITVILQYPDQIAQDARTITNDTVAQEWSGKAAGQPRIAVIGAGNFTKARLLPALKGSGAILDTICSAQGVSSASGASKFGFIHNTNDLDTVWNRDDIDTVFITTRHNNHGHFVKTAVEHGKNAFVEKPLTLSEIELDEIIALMSEKGASKERPDGPRVMVGFNRRFAPLVQQMKTMLSGRTQPVTAIYMANAGDLPPDHWTQDPKVGGGRILGEACHFIDLLAYLVGSPITAVSAVQMGDAPGVLMTEDKMSITLEFADGSHGTVHYFANGSKSFPKERIEVFSEGRILQMDNFRKLNTSGFAGGESMVAKLKALGKGQDKGHETGFLSFVESIRSGKPSPIAFDEIVNATRASFAAVKAAKEGRRVEVK